MAQKPVGKASIKVEVDGLEEAKRGLDDMKTKTEDVGKAGRSGFGELDDAVGKAGQTIEDSTQGLRRFQGAITGIIGVVGGLGAVAGLAFGSINTLLQKSKERAEEVDNALQAIQKTGQSVADDIRGVGASQGDAIGAFESELAKRRQEVQDKFTEGTKDLRNQISEIKSDLATFGDIQRIEANLRLREKELKVFEDARDLQLKIIDREADAARDRLKAIEDAKRAEQDSALASSVRAANRQLELSLLDEESQVIERLSDTEKMLGEQIRDAEEQGFTEKVKALREQLKLEGEIAKVRIDGIVSANDAKNAQSTGGEMIAAMREMVRAANEQAKAINENTRELVQQRQRELNFTRDIRQIAQNTGRRNV